MDKRRMLMISQMVTFATHLTTAVLVLTGVINPLMVFVTTFVAGSAMAFNQPARQSLIPRMVPRESLANAVALNSAAVNLMKIGGPSIAGLVLVFFHLGELYLIQAAIYVWVIFSTWRITVRTNESPRSDSSMFSELIEGFRTVRSDRMIFYILLISLVMFIWGMPFQSVFVPLIAKRELGLSNSGLGLLVSCVGAGALIGALTIATVGDTLRRRGVVMFGMLIAFSLGLFGLALGNSVILVVPALMVAGAMQTSFMSLNNAYVLGRIPIEMQGRVMSLFSLDRGLIPLGAMLGGVLAESLGPQDGLTVMASICLGSTVLLLLLVPTLRKIS
jgi:MFS family permease